MKTSQRIIAVAFAGIGFAAAIAQEPAPSTNYAMLPALPNSTPAKAVLLDVADTGDKLVAVGERGLVTWSADAGESWQQADSPVSLSLTSVFFVDPQHGWAVGHEGLILATTDGGESWVVQQTGRDTVEQSIPQLEAEVERLQAAIEATDDPDQQDLIAFDLEYAEFALDDAHIALEDGPAEPLLDVWFRNPQEGFAVGAYGAFLGTSDGGNNWQLLSRTLDNPDKLHLNRISGSPDNTLYIAGESGLAFRSDDSGETWQKLDVPYDGSLFGVLTPSESEVLVHGLRGNILISDDKGESWRELDSGTETTLIGSRQVNGKLLLVGASGTVLQGNSDGSDLVYRYHPGRSTIASVIPLDGDALLLVGTDGAIKIDAFDSLEGE